jgi:hypothetical protein
MAAPAVHPATAAEDAMRERERRTPTHQELRVQTGPRQAGVSTRREDNKGKRGLTSAEVKTVVDANRAEVDGCFSQYAAYNAATPGRIDVQLEIHSDGRIRNLESVRDDYSDEGLSACIHAHLSSWQFPAWEGTGVMRMTLPFAFNP